MDNQSKVPAAPSILGLNFGNIKNCTSNCSIHTSIDSMKKYTNLVKNDPPSFINTSNFIDTDYNNKISSQQGQTKNHEENIDFQVLNSGNSQLTQHQQIDQKKIASKLFEPKMLSPKSAQNSHLIDQMKKFLKMNSTMQGKQPFEYRSSITNAQKIFISQSLSCSFSSSSLKSMIATNQQNNKAGSFSNSSCMKSPQKASIAGMSRKNKLGNNRRSLINIRQSQEDSIPGLLQRQSSLDLTKTPSCGVMNIPNFLSSSLQGSFIQNRNSTSDQLIHIQQSHQKDNKYKKNLNVEGEKEEQEEEEEKEEQQLQDENLQFDKPKSKLCSLPNIPKLSLANIIHKKREQQAFNKRQEEEENDQKQQNHENRISDAIPQSFSFISSQILNEKQRNQSNINIPYFHKQEDTLNNLDDQDAVQILSPVLSKEESGQNNFQISFSNNNFSKINYQYPKIQTLILELQKILKKLVRDTFNKLKPKAKIKTSANFNISIGLTYLLSSRIYQEYYQQSIGAKRQAFKRIIHWNRQSKADLRRELNYSPRQGVAKTKFTKSSILQIRTFGNVRDNSINSQRSFGIELTSSSRQSPMFKVQMKTGDLNGAFTQDQSIFEQSRDNYCQKGLNQFQ